MSRPTFNTQDELSREAIVLDIDKNLFIEAGAGSGKTTMLVNRMVAMIEAGIPVDKICAITFTKNAALEFYDRFQAKLINRSNPNNNDEPKRAGDLNKPTEETRERCKKALENIDLCFMGTIDSFCNIILSEHPTEANIPSDARLISDTEAKEIYKQFYIECRNGNYGKEIKELTNRFSMFFYKAEDSFAQLVGEIMDRRNINFVVDDKLCIDFFKCFTKDRDDMKKVLNTFNKNLSKLVIPSKKNENLDLLEDVYLPANETIQKGWHYNYSGVEWSLKSIADISYEGGCQELGLISESVVRDAEGGTKTILNIKDEDNPNALIYKLQNYKYQNSLKLVLTCIKPLEEKMRKEGKFTFFDYLYYLRNMLEEDAHNEGKLIEYINKRHSYFLIDEFQDTNPMQAEIFFYLSAVDPKQKSWKECKPKPGSLFIVGDPKQSIYRFRAADVSSYLNIKQMFNDENNKVKYLVNNFRSKNEIKTYFNNVFNELMPEEQEEQSKYIDIENTNDLETEIQKNEFRGLYTYKSYSESLLKDYPDMSDETQLAKIVKSLVNNSSYQIIGEDKNLRTIKYKDFMIVFAAKKNIASCISEFKEQGIPVRVEGKVLFEKCEGLKMIANIYQTITNTNNQISLVSTLYSPVFGLNENDIAEYRSNKGLIKICFDREYGNNKVEKALCKLRETTKSISTLSPSSLFEKIMDDYEIFKYVTSENLEVVFYTLELIRSEEISGNIITFEDAVKYMNELLTGESGIERCLSLKQDEDAVHIANLHKVKGLEAPIVILTKAGSASNNPDIRIEYGDKKANGYIISIVDRNSDSEIQFPLISTNQLTNKAELEKESKKKENDRLIYVAATRAKNVLIVNEPKRAGKNGPQAMGNRWKVLKEQIDNPLFENIKENLDNTEKTTNSINAKDLYDDIELTKTDVESTYCFKQPSDIQVSSRINEQPYENEGLINSEKETYSTLIGTMVHRLMEMIIMSKDNISKDNAINNILTEYVTEEFNEYLDVFKNKLVNVYEVVHNGGFIQKGNAPQDILATVLSADKFYSEVPFTLREGDVLWNGIIDLIYEKDNELHIIDWKTNKNDEGLDQHYKDQLEAYKKATKQVLGKDVKDVLIYHISIN